MPFYELILVLRPVPKTELSNCLKRAANLIWNNNGALKQIQYLGLLKTPTKLKSKFEEGVKYKEANFFLYHVSLNAANVDRISPELKLDYDILQQSWNRTIIPKIPESYECTLGEEVLPPALRPSVQPLIRNKNHRASTRRAQVRDYHTSCRGQTTMAANNTPPPGLLSIFDKTPTRLARIRFLGNLFQSGGHEIRIAGGAVRDLIRGEVPSDIDFATTSKPDESLELVKQHQDIFRIIITDAGKKHGTVAVKFKKLNVDLSKVPIKKLASSDSTEAASQAQDVPKPEYDDESPFEITTLRCDRVTDGRHAEVEFVRDWKIDAERRDLTINAMFLTLDKGELVDFFNGESDLKNGLIKFVGDADTRLQEDYLRILRFFRFWSRYGQSKPDQATLDAIARSKTGLDDISGERLWTELRKCLMTIPSEPAFRLMAEVQLLDHLGLVDKNSSPISESRHQAGLDRLKIIETFISYYLKNSLMPMLAKNPDDSRAKKLKELLPAILFSTLIDTKDICLNARNRLKFSNSERDTMLYIIENRDKQVDVKTLKYHLAVSSKTDREQAWLRIWSLLIAKNEIALYDQLSEWKIPEFPITGHDIVPELRSRKIAMHRMKNIQTSLLEEWSQSDFTMTKDELKEFMIGELECLEVKTNKSS